MLRAVLIGLVLSCWAAGCGPVGAPAPSGMEAVHVTVRNAATGPALFDVVTWSGMEAGYARPASLPAGTTADVSFVVPTWGTWAIRVNGWQVLDKRDLQDMRRNAASFATCELRIDLLTDDSFSVECGDR
jgi:hypothetical protein